MTIRRRDFLTGSTALAALTAANAGLATGLSWMTERTRPKKRPHILLIVADDMRADVMGWAGHRLIRTPSLDRLAADSMCFTNNFVTTSLCPTSRASILTGRYASMHGIWSFDQPLQQELMALSFPVLLRQAGYTTGFIGKWGLADARTHPKEAFDHWEGMADESSYRTTPIHANELQTRQAEAYLRKQDGKTPFMLMLSLKAPHAPFDPPKRFASLYRDVDVPTPPTMTEDAYASRPKMVRDHWPHEKTPFLKKEAYQHYVKSYYRLISAMDESVGRLLATLEEIGLSEDCCVIFTSDNGLLMGEYMLMGKAFGYEPSIRTPMMMRMPANHYPAGRPMGAYDALTLNIDIAPTLLEMAGIRAIPPMHGRSLMDFTNTLTPPWRSSFLYEQYHARWGLPRCVGMRTSHIKYMHYFKENRHEFELFNLLYDPLEMHNRISDPHYAKLLERFKNQSLDLQGRVKSMKTV